MPLNGRRSNEKVEPMVSSIGAFRIALMRWGGDVSSVLILRFWGFFLASFILAAGFAEHAYKQLNLPQRYVELIVGSIAWSYENKFHDYAVLYALIGAFLVALVAIASLAARLSRWAGLDAAQRLHDFLLVLCAPAVLWFAGLLTTKSASLDLLRLSQLLLLAGLILVVGCARRDLTFWRGEADRLFSTLHYAALFLMFAVLGVAALGVASNRLGGQVHSHHWMASGLTLRLMAAVLCLALAICLVLVWRTRNPEQLMGRLRRLMTAAQCLLPLFLFCLVPPAWTTATSQSLEAGYPLTAFGKLLVLACVLAAYVELYVRTRRVARSPTMGTEALQCLTVGSAVGLLLFLKSTPYSLPTLSADDYHFGEMLVPWWSWFKMGLVPFWDYAPARGLMNYFPGLLSSLVFGGAPAAIYATYPIIYAALAAGAFIALRPVIGTAAAFVALLLGPFANGLGEIDLAVSIFLFAFCRGWFTWRRDHWLVAFAGAAVLLLLYAPGQGALALLACTPLALAALWSLYRSDRQRLGYLLLAIGGVFVLIFGLTPLGKMFVGALRYGAEQSQINSIAHGIQWRASFGLDGLNPWAFELMRTSFVLVALWAGVLVFKAPFMRDVAGRKRVLVYAIPVFLIACLFVVRAAGRIDVGGSRLAIASVWALALLLPMLIFTSVRVRAIHFLIWIGIMGVLMPYAGSLLLTGYAANFNPPDAAALKGAPNVSTIQNGRLGTAMADPAHLNRIVAVRKVLDLVLDPNETYLDLSGRHAMYYYVERKPPVESASTYNLVGEAQQLRAIRSLRAASPPAILLSADNITHDGGPLSLRTNLLYREAMLLKGYKLVSIDKQVWLIKPDRLGRLALSLSASAVDLAAAAVPVLDPIYRLRFLASVPGSWGRSAQALESEMEPVLSLPPDVLPSTHSLHDLGGGGYATAGDDPYVRFDLSGFSLSGKKAGILSFEFSCASVKATPVVSVMWSTPDSPEGERTLLTFTGHQGRLIVPVDSAPSWILADRISTIRFDLEGDLAGCEKFAIRNVAFLARTATLSTLR